MARRPVFEEVSETRPSETVAPQAGLIDRGGQGGRGQIRVWLAILFVMVMAMIVVGGLTREEIGHTRRPLRFHGRSCARN